MSVKVLIVDSSKIERLHIAGVLEKYDIESVGCDNAAVAVEFAKKDDYAIVFWDCLIDEENCFSEICELDVHVVILGESKDYLSIRKPINPRKLKACVELLMDCDLTEEENIEEPYASQTNESDAIMEIDKKTGVENCGSEEGYVEALEIFYDTIDNRADEIEKYFNENDIKNYTIKVHALKSSAKLVGALKLSDMAKDLEMAGHRNDETFIKQGTEKLLECYRGLKPVLRPLVANTSEDDGKEYMDADDYKDTITAIAEFAGVSDYDSVEMMLDTVKDYKLKDEDAKRIKKIETFLIELKWEEIIKECRI